MAFFALCLGHVRIFQCELKGKPRLNYKLRKKSDAPCHIN